MGTRRANAKASPKKKHITLKSLFAFNLTEKSSTTTTTLKKPSPLKPENEEVLSLIAHCTILYTFTDPSESPSALDRKRLKLIQLLSIIKTSKTPFGSQVLSPLFIMLSTNLFRPLPPCINSHIFMLPDDEDLPAIPSPLWPHQQIVYDMLLCLITTYDTKFLKPYINGSFLLNLLTLFQSDDPREREKVRSGYHRIYSKFTFHRLFMRKAMNDVFLQYIFENDHNHSGIGDLLEIWGTIINGFSVPIKDEHKVFLMRVLIPLHKPKGMYTYHRQLGYCVLQFVQKEPGLTGAVLRAILRCWPVTNGQKEVIFMGELEELVDHIEPEEYRSLALPMCTRIAKCLSSWNSQVAERALHVWNNEQFVKMVSQATEDVFPVIVKAIENNMKWHWSKSVKQLTENVKEKLEEMEPGLYDQCQTQLEMQESAAKNEREKKWERVETPASPNQILQQPQCVCVSN